MQAFVWEGGLGTRLHRAGLRLGGRPGHEVSMMLSSYKFLNSLLPPSDPEFSPTAATSSSASPSPTSTVILMVITDPTPASSKIGLWVGVAVGITLVLALTLLTTTFLYVFCCGRFRTEGFYKTNENRGSEVALPRYSASLKRVSSQRVTLERNGTVHNRTPTEQDQDKEFFM